MRVEFKLLENEDATFCETEMAGVPSVGQWLHLTRNDLASIPSTSPDACRQCFITRIEWQSTGVNHARPNEAIGPMYPVVHVSYDDPQGSPSISFDAFARLCGAARVIANCLNAKTDGDVEYMEPDDVLVLADGMFRVVDIWRKPKKGDAREYTISAIEAEHVAREWWVASRTKERQRTFAELRVMVKQLRARFASK